MKSEVGYILVVDDNEMNRDMLSRRLVSRGHIVDQAVDGHQALKMIYNNKYDLILLDVMMPEISGLEVLQE
ncbi:MAG TPA: response regulator, partial [Candidatus Sumerlaeota bacterium]|nr:response regulator [Candidatus Sumerlaeota bacterium]